MNNLHTNWIQSSYDPTPDQPKLTATQAAQADRDEQCRVKPYARGNAIAVCPSPQEAEWIAQRLNLAAKLEQMTYDYATGKTDGSEIVEMVQDHING